MAHNLASLRCEDDADIASQHEYYMDDLDQIIDQELLLQSDRPSHRRPFSAGTLRSMFGDTQPLSPHRTPTPAAPPRAAQSQDEMDSLIQAAYPASNPIHLASQLRGRWQQHAAEDCPAWSHAVTLVLQSVSEILASKELQLSAPQCSAVLTTIDEMRLRVVAMQPSSNIMPLAVPPRQPGAHPTPVPAGHVPSTLDEKQPLVSAGDFHIFFTGRFQFPATSSPGRFEDWLRAFPGPGTSPIRSRSRWST